MLRLNRNTIRANRATIVAGGRFVAVAPPPANDVTPNAVDWTDITGGGAGTTNTQTISGINTTITLRIESIYDGYGEFSIYINGTQFDLTFDIQANGFSNQSVNNGDQIYFSRASSFGSAETVTVKNASDGNVVLDTFTISLDGDI